MMFDYTNVFLRTLVHTKMSQILSQKHDSWATIHLPPLRQLSLPTRCLKLAGPCTFESDQCQWTDTSDGQSHWLRQRASNGTEPPTDHTTGTGDCRWRGVIVNTLFPQQLSQHVQGLLIKHVSPCSQATTWEWIWVRGPHRVRPDSRVLSFPLHPPIARLCEWFFSGLYFIIVPKSLPNTLFWYWAEYLKYELLNAARHLPLFSTTQLQSNTLRVFLPPVLNAGFTSTSVQRVLGHSECLCSKLKGVKQSCGHAVTTLSPIGPLSICL